MAETDEQLPETASPVERPKRAGTILGRLAQAVREQNWFAVALEAGIVVLGVFLGLQANNWNQDRLERARATSYLERLAADLAAERTTWEDALRYFGTTGRHAESALDGDLGPVETLGAQFLIDLYQASQERNLSARRATYDELVATGGIEALRDPALRNALSIHYDLSDRRQAVVEDVTAYRSVARQHMDHRVQAAVVAACGDRYVRDRHGYVGIELPETCEIDLPDPLVQQAVAQLHGNEVVRQHLRYQLSNLRSRLQALENAITSTQNTRALVQERLGAAP